MFAILNQKGITMADKQLSKTTPSELYFDIFRPLVVHSGESRSERRHNNHTRSGSRSAKRNFSKQKVEKTKRRQRRKSTRKQHQRNRRRKR